MTTERDGRAAGPAEAAPALDPECKPTDRPAPADQPREAKQRAAVILEVLAGVRSPTEAAQVLDVSVNHYYLLEEKALAAVVAACAPQAPGRKNEVARRCAQLEQECQRWQRECARQQALVRAAQRGLGLSAPPPTTAKEAGRKRRKRRPVVRALKAAARLQPPDAAAAVPKDAAASPPAGENGPVAGKPRRRRDAGQEAPASLRRGAGCPAPCREVGGQPPGRKPCGDASRPDRRSWNVCKVPTKPKNAGS
jgi:hypothetical protein